MEQKFSQIEFVYRNRCEKEDPKGEKKKLCVQHSRNDSTLLIFQTTSKHCTLRMQYELSHNYSLNHFILHTASGQKFPNDLHFIK